MTYTAANFINSPAFIDSVIPDALALIAKTNAQTLEATKTAFDMQVPNVIDAVAKLVAKSAQHCADEANAGRLWN